MFFPNPYIVNWRLTRIGAVSDQMPGVTIPYEAFPGSIGVMPGEPEIKEWKAREAELATASGVVLGPSPGGALPASVCGEKGSNKDDCLRTIPPRENGGNMGCSATTNRNQNNISMFHRWMWIVCGRYPFAQGDGEVAGTAIEMEA